ncbi:histone-lysine N-methyltransferase, H3 lysine-36 specific [Kwoniella mangroviensis CBS 10435]|uniref:Histone-lysine N-methyltransferase, H3 lysine-36 specific n=1 Tax=Kwoniella mangroviensis CBS 10435 TaxID=1331196 RepID=A0A1B9J1N7_9TREE|nr:histone-lysine N-methyltransferase, H3 lysine-36 specific [Kwoniella mangroviensis CBS 10435]
MGEEDTPLQLSVKDEKDDILDMVLDSPSIVQVQENTLEDLFKADEQDDKPEIPITTTTSGTGSPRSVIGEEDLKSRTHTRDDQPQPSSSSSSSPFPTIGGGGGGGRGRPKKVKDEKPQIQLIDDLPTAWDEAHETFVSLDKCHYESKGLGLSREQDEMMVCDCIYDKHDPDTDPCGPDSDCINRALFIECLAGECRAGKHCHNQQFSRKQYANVEVVLTEKKGFGLRAGSDIPSNTLIYEYIGEVVAEKTFRKRMQQYADEGIRHFYFMMLQKEEYIDATKKGGIGRFANHSCNPNSEVQKWVVGRRLRMGIFTKRDVMKGEEITFNYNVDRYGHDAQICYCGEPNCVGTIGGKTQTDVSLSTMNDLFLDALGITDEVEAGGMKGNKKKKSRQLDEDFVPTLRPIQEPEVQKVAAAMRQSMENKTMMSRLLQRIKMTEEPAVQRQLGRMHGFSLMSMVLAELADDREIVLLALESMSKWKLQIRNKIEDSNIEEPIRKLQDSQDEEISKLAKQLLEYWSTLELSYKIPRVKKLATLDAEDEAGTTTIAEAASHSTSTPRRPDAWENTTQIQLDIAPVRPRIPIPSFHRPRPPPPAPAPRPSLPVSQSSDRLKLDAIIALAQQNLQSAVSNPAPSESPAAESSRSGSMATIEDDERRKRQKRSHYDLSDTEGDEEAKKEKRLTKLVGEVVVRSMSKYKEQMEHDTFKRYAKECTGILVEKEKKGHSYSTSRHPTLSEEKKAKMKAFTKEFTHKVLKRLKEKGKLRRINPNHNASSTTTPTSTSTSSRNNLKIEGGTINTPTPSGTIIETPTDPEGSTKEGDLLDDIFGKDDIDIDMEMDMDMEGSPSSTSAPASRKESMSLGNGGKSPVDEIKTAPVAVKKMNGGYTVERLDLSTLGKVNGMNHHQQPSQTPSDDRMNQ